MASPPPPAPANAEPARRGRLFWLTWDFLVPLAIALALSIWMAAAGKDLEWQRAAAGPDGSWPKGDTPFWQFLYQYGPLPATLVCIGAIIGLAAGVASPKLRPWRRVFWYLVLLVVIAPGIIANAIFKEHWGRPRPREVDEFGGRFAFEPFFSLDPAGTGKSFPCGHATMGFFFVAGYFLLRRTHFRTSLFVLAAALILGGLMSYMRMIQGGHFATDGVWAAAFVFLTAAGLFHALGLNRQLLDAPQASASSRIPLKVKLAGGLAITALVAGIALAMPYSAKRDYSILHPEGDSLILKPAIEIVLGDAEIIPDDSLHITGRAWGHGLPTSQIASRWDEELNEDGTLRVRLVQRLSGYLTEIRQTLKVEIPWDRTDTARFELGPGAVRLELPEPNEPKKIELRLKGTALLIELAPGTRLQISAEDAIASRIEGKWEAADSGPRYGLVFSEWQEGTAVKIRAKRTD